MVLDKPQTKPQHFRSIRSTCGGRAHSNRFLAALSVHDYGQLAPNLERISLPCGAVVHNHGDAVERLYFPHRGMVSIVIRMHDGAMVETASLGRTGIVCGNAGLGSHVAIGRAIVQLPLVASWLAAAQFQEAARQSSAIRDLAVRYNDLLLTEIQQTVACNSLHSVRQRLCRWLLQSRDSWDDDILPVIQEFLGQMLGACRTSVNASTQVLQARGAIRCARGRIQIVDRAELERSACECYFTLRQYTDKVFPPTG